MKARTIQGNHLQDGHFEVPDENTQEKLEEMGFHRIQTWGDEEIGVHLYEKSPDVGPSAERFLAIIRLGQTRTATLADDVLLMMQHLKQPLEFISLHREVKRRV